MNDKKNRQVFLVEGNCLSSVFQSRPLGRNYFEFDYFVWKLLYSVYEVPQKIACNAALELDQFLHSVKNSFSLSLIWCNTYLVKFLGSSKNLVEWFGLRTPMKHKELKNMAFQWNIRHFPLISFRCSFWNKIFGNLYFKLIFNSGELRGFLSEVKSDYA